jgi:hypothetical protein
MKNNIDSFGIILIIVIAIVGIVAMILVSIPDKTKVETIPEGKISFRKEIIFTIKNGDTIPKDTLYIPIVVK